MVSRLDAAPPEPVKGVKHLTPSASGKTPHGFQWKVEMTPKKTMPSTQKTPSGIFLLFIYCISCVSNSNLEGHVFHVGFRPPMPSSSKGRQSSKPRQRCFHMEVSKTRGVFSPQIIHLFIGFSMKFSPSILGLLPLFLETPISFLWIYSTMLVREIFVENLDRKIWKKKGQICQTFFHTCWFGSPVGSQLCHPLDELQNENSFHTRKPSRTALPCAVSTRPIADSAMQTPIFSFSLSCQTPWDDKVT